MAQDLEFDALFRVEFPRLVAVGVGMTGNVDVATDLVQETMARAHSHWDTVANADVPEAWLRRVLTNLVTDHYRRNASERNMATRLASQSDRSLSGSGLVSESRMAEFVSVLSQRQRAVVVLFYVDDMSVSEIGGALDIAEGTVKALLWKARRRLKHYLKGLEL